MKEIFINEGDMPESCITCKFIKSKDLTAYCVATSNEICKMGSDNEDVGAKRHSSCPLKIMSN